MGVVTIFNEQKNSSGTNAKVTILNSRKTDNFSAPIKTKTGLWKTKILRPGYCARESSECRLIILFKAVIKYFNLEWVKCVLPSRRGI